MSAAFDLIDALLSTPQGVASFLIGVALVVLYVAFLVAASGQEE